MDKFTRNFLSALMIGASASVAWADSPAVAPAATAPTAKAPEAIGQGPKAQFAVPVYDFGRVQSGDLVKYTFIFTNTGDQTLEVSHVQPSCGCTTAGEFTHKVEPGQTGKVPIQFNSANFNGQVFKTISVTSNDKQKPVTVLQLKGTVWKPIELIPPYTVINVQPDAGRAAASIKIINHTDAPLELSAPELNTPTFVAALLTNSPGKEYTVALNSAVDLNSGNIQGKVSMKTSSAKTPKLDIPFWVNVQPLITVVPQRINLPPTPVKSKTPATITIQNNSTNALSLSDAAVNAPGVEVQLKEVQPGRLFNAIVSFPEGFEPPMNKALDLTIKSSQSRMPEIKVPISPPPHVVIPSTGPQPPKPTASITPPPLPSTAVR